MEQTLFTLCVGFGFKESGVFVLPREWVEDVNNSSCKLILACSVVLDPSTQVWGCDYSIAAVIYSSISPHHHHADMTLLSIMVFASYVVAILVVLRSAIHRHSCRWCGGIVCLFSRTRACCTCCFGVRSHLHGEPAPAIERLPGDHQSYL